MQGDDLHLYLKCHSSTGVFQSFGSKTKYLVSTLWNIGRKWVKSDDYTVGNSECEKRFCVKIDIKLCFNNRIFDLHKKASRKIYT